VGDHIELDAQKGAFVYTVDKIEIVRPTDVDVLRSRPQPTLTLVTCYPFYFVGDASRRYIVHASLLDPETASTAKKIAPQQ
jgi:sortase A